MKERKKKRIMDDNGQERKKEIKIDRQIERKIGRKNKRKNKHTSRGPVTKKDTSVRPIQ